MLDVLINGWHIKILWPCVPRKFWTAENVLLLCAQGLLKGSTKCFPWTFDLIGQKHRVLYSIVCSQGITSCNEPWIPCPTTPTCDMRRWILYTVVSMKIVNRSVARVDCIEIWPCQEAGAMWFGHQEWKNKINMIHDDTYFDSTPVFV